MRLFWEEQKKAARLHESRGMRWHPMIIRWALNLKMLSSAAYTAARTSGFMRLPSERTLRDYVHFYTAKPGFQKEANDHLIIEAQLDLLSEGILLYQGMERQ